MSEAWLIGRKVLGGVIGLGLLTSCESASQTVATNPESSLRLSPQELTPAAGCRSSSDHPSDMQTYVVTLIDVTPNADEEIKPKAVLSGPPTSCASGITFAVSAERGSLEIGNTYVALVDGYTEGPLAATKRNGRAVETNGIPATPDWHWLCSFGSLKEAVIEDLLEIANAIPTRPMPPSSSSADAGTVGMSPTIMDAALDLDAASSSDAFSSDAASPDAASPDAAGTASMDVSSVDAAANSIDGDDPASSDAPDAAAGSDRDASIPQAAPKSALELLLEVAKEPTAPAPAKLVQSRLATLRGCIALP